MSYPSPLRRVAAHDREILSTRYLQPYGQPDQRRLSGELQMAELKQRHAGLRRRYRKHPRPLAELHPLLQHLTRSLVLRAHHHPQPV